MSDVESGSGVEGLSPELAPPSEERGHIPALDGVRAIAILMVIVFHCRFVGLIPPNGDLVDRTTGIGWAGVDLFFVLSGFLITGLLLDAKGGDGYFRSFYARRFLRIFPPYYGFLVAYCIILPRIGAVGLQVPADYHHWGWNFWTYTVNFAMARSGNFSSASVAIAWSLAIEEQFYLVWPLVVLTLSRRALMRLCVVLMAAAFLFRLALIATHASWLAVYTLTPARMDTLAAGAFLAALARGPARRPVVAGRARAVAVLAGLTVLGLAVTGDGPFVKGKAMQLVGYSALALLFAALLWLAVEASPRAWSARLLSSKVMRAVGRYSYTMYLFHYAIILALASRVVSPPHLQSIAGSLLLAEATWTMLVVTTTFAAAFVSFHVYEKHFLKLKRYFPMPRPASSGSRSG
ncbi:MAG: acyltransferase [Actinobacteria bacterium]|nr:MAG: acyltransferase [Actinomycetota bacterium]